MEDMEATTEMETVDASTDTTAMEMEATIMETDSIIGTETVETGLIMATEDHIDADPASISAGTAAEAVTIEMEEMTTKVSLLPCLITAST
jgi:hypothetical protein